MQLARMKFKSIFKKKISFTLLFFQTFIKQLIIFGFLERINSWACRFRNVEERRLRQCVTKAVLYLNNVEEDENGIVLPHICLVDESSAYVNDALQDRAGFRGTFATHRIPALGPSYPRSFLPSSLSSLIRHLSAHVPHFWPAAHDIL